MFRRSPPKPAGLEPAVFRPAPRPARPRRFISLRWKVVFPVLVSVLAVAMLGTYLLSDSVARGVHDNEINRLLVYSRSVLDRAAQLETDQQRELARIAYTAGVPELVAAQDSLALHPLLEPLALAADLDVLLVADPAGREVIGLQRVTTPTGAVDYAVSSGTDLADLLADTPMGDMQALLARGSQGHTLLLAGPVLRGDQTVGTVLIGLRLDRVLDTLRGGDRSALVLFGPGGEFLGATFKVDDDLLAALRLPPAAWDPARPPGEVPVASVTLHNQPYNAAYFPLELEGRALGVIGTYVADHTLYATALSRQAISLVFAGLAALVIVVSFAVAAEFAGRLGRITRTARALAGGNLRARTHLRPRDEIGELGAALDRLADQYQRKTDALQRALRQQRQETTHLSAVLESIPDGLVVQDLDGRVLTINNAARDLLGGQRAFRAARLHELTALVTEKLGPALAPGIYALGDPTRVPLEGRMLHAQAAAILTRQRERIGTVIVLRDITAEVEREQAREELLERLEEQATVPSSLYSYDSLAGLAHEVARNARSLQRVIAELRDLSTFEPRDLQTGQRALALNDLVWNVAAEWQPLAKSAQARLRVQFGPRGQYVLGDDRRLRWAIGNVLDNALKYAPPGGTIRLEARIPENNPAAAEITIEDQGYGIAPEDLPHVFTRFYRGTPRDAAGQPVRQPGTGQGLFIARRVIEAHGGTIALASRVGAGTTVVIRLPLTAPVTLEMPGAGAPPPEHEQAPTLSQGEGFDTVPLESRQPRRR